MQSADVPTDDARQLSSRDAAHRRTYPRRLRLPVAQFDLRLFRGRPGASGKRALGNPRSGVFADDARQPYSRLERCHTDLFRRPGAGRRASTPKAAQAAR